MKQFLTSFLIVALVLAAAMAWGLTPSPTPTRTPTPVPSPTSTSAGCFFGASGYVTDSMGKPIAGAAIHADTSGTTTDASGYYSIGHIQLNCNALYVSASANGYATVGKSTGSEPGSYTLNFTLIPYVSDPLPIIPGDVNGDRVVNVVDAMLTAQFAAGSGPAGFLEAPADVNGSGLPDILDALIIARYSAGLIGNLIIAQPKAGQVGTQVQITGISFDPTGNEIRFIDPKLDLLYYASIKADSADGTHLTFSVPSSINPSCYYDVPPCGAPGRPVEPGSHQITVINSKGESYPILFTVGVTL